jgi:tRNA-specific 2-thiouridylase
MSHKPKALVLFSGGLDSQLAAVNISKVQDIEVKLIHFYTGFCITEHKRRLGIPNKDGKIPQNPALKAAAHLELPIEIIDISQEYINVILNPKFGYGKNVNPCLDCRIFMLLKLKEIMEKENYDFIVTGEVLGQRPMSQTKDKLSIIEKETGLKGLIVRPLSAKLLPKTIPEEKDLIKRELMWDISGRSRTKQINLAKTYNIDYEQPSGGCCYLTDEHFAIKFKEELSFKKSLNWDDLSLMTVGRHLRLPNGTKMIISRNEGETRFLNGFKNRFDWAYVENKAIAILKELNEEDIDYIAKIMARYCGNNTTKVTLSINKNMIKELAEPLEDDIINNLKIGDMDHVRRR